MGREQCPVSGLGIFVGDVIRIWVCVQLIKRLGCDINVGDRTEVSDKGQGRGHLVTRCIHTQRDFRRNGVRGERKAWGGVCQSSGQGSPEKALFRKTHATQRPACSPPPDLSVNRLSRTVMNS